MSDKTSNSSDDSEDSLEEEHDDDGSHRFATIATYDY